MASARRRVTYRVNHRTGKFIEVHHEEDDFQDRVLLVARHNDWRWFHTHDSRRCPPGLPDLILLKPPRIIFAELKSEKGRVSKEQKLWLADLTLCPGVEVYLWRPADMDAVKAILEMA